MRIIGLTGNIACGKSTVSKTLIENGIPVIDADQVARDVVVPGSKGLSLIKDHFGQQFINFDGTLNREALGLMVFSNKEALKELNLIMGPLIEEEAHNQFNKLSQQGYQLAIYDAALLCENGNQERYRPLIVVNCSPEMQLQRLIKRNGLTKEQAMHRISSQLPAEEKVKVANYIINSEGSIEESIQQTKIIIQDLKNKYC